MKVPVEICITVAASKGYDMEEARDASLSDGMYPILCLHITLCCQLFKSAIFQASCVSKAKRLVQQLFDCAVW